MQLHYSFCVRRTNFLHVADQGITELDVAIFMSSQKDPMLRPTAASLLGCEIVGNYR